MANKWRVEINPATGKERDDWWYLKCKAENHEIPTYRLKREHMFRVDNDLVSKPFFPTGFTLPTKSELYLANEDIINEYYYSGKTRAQLARTLKVSKTTVNNFYQTLEYYLFKERMEP